MRLSNTRSWEPLGDRTDKPGRVLVRVYLAQGKGGNVKGNITRTFSVHGATVGEVATIARQAVKEVTEKVDASMKAERQSGGYGTITRMEDDFYGPDQ